MCAIVSYKQGNNKTLKYNLLNNSNLLWTHMLFIFYNIYDNKIMLLLVFKFVNFIKSSTKQILSSLSLLTMNIIITERFVLKDSQVIFGDFTVEWLGKVSKQASTFMKRFQC